MWPCSPRGPQGQWGTQNRSGVQGPIAKRCPVGGLAGSPGAERRGAVPPGGTQGVWGTPHQGPLPQPGGVGARVCTSDARMLALLSRTRCSHTVCLGFPHCDLSASPSGPSGCGGFSIPRHPASPSPFLHCVCDFNCSLGKPLLTSVFFLHLMNHPKSSRLLPRVLGAPLTAQLGASGRSPDLSEQRLLPRRVRTVPPAVQARET